MLTIHHLNNSRSFRVLWLLEELEMPYRLELYERDKKTMLAPAALKKIHPLGKAPVLTDGQTTIAESAVILEYILDKAGESPFRPSMQADYSRYLNYKYWMHYAEGSLMSPLLLSLVFQKLTTSPTPTLMRPIGKVFSIAVHKALITPQIETHFKFINDELGKSEWFVGGGFSAADIQMSFPLEAAEGRVELEEYGNINVFLKKVRQRPAYKRAIEKGGALNLNF